MTEPPRRGVAETLGSAVDSAVGRAVGAVGAVGQRVGRHVGAALHLPGVHRTGAQQTPDTLGRRPGLESEPDLATRPAAGAVRIRCVDYGPAHFEEQVVGDLEAFLAKPRPAAASMRWIHVEGLHPWVLDRFRSAYSMHTLAAEDALHVPQRPKVEPYDDALFVVVRMLRLVGESVDAQQLSAFFRADLLLSFQERQADVWKALRTRIANPTSRLRANDASFLLYAILDGVVDACFPILERFGDRLETLDAEILESPAPPMLRSLHEIKRELSLLRRVTWPMREVASDLLRKEHALVSDQTRTYLRDVQDHAVQALDIVEVHREMAASLTDLYMSSVANRMNEIMKVLTIMASLFIPVTFLAGVYGMNFEHIPELGWMWSYPVFWGLCISIIGGLLVYFRRKGWIGDG